VPTAIAAQNRRRSSRPAADGRPGDDNGARPHRSERRLCLFIATSFVKVLRRPLESALAASVAVMHEPTAMQRPPVMQSLFQRVEHEARVRCS
jgi:hypothetical protein